MNNFKYKILHELKTEQHVAQFNDVISKFDASPEDSFMIYWMGLMYFYPLGDQLRGVFNKMETDSQRVGVLSRHLIKRAKEIEVPQMMIDEYVEIKNKADYWSDFYNRVISEHKEKLTNGVRQSLKSAKLIGEYEQKKRQQRQELHKRTFALIRKLINHRTK